MAKWPSPGPGRETVIGQGAVLEGNIALQDRIRIDGRLRGQLATPCFLVVGAQGEVEADLIEVGQARIEGKVWGRLRASERVYLAASAVFRGALETPRLVVEEGAVFSETSLPEPP